MQSRTSLLCKSFRIAILSSCVSSGLLMSTYVGYHVMLCSFKCFHPYLTQASVTAKSAMTYSTFFSSAKSFSHIASIVVELVVLYNAFSSSICFFSSSSFSFVKLWIGIFSK